MSAIADKATGKTAWLTLAASPVFAAMALMSAIDAPPLALCAAGATLLPVDGMTAMYLLMSLFHLPPWLKLAGRG
ncbi:hypothetical protein [Sphingomonas sp.]|uniref:hypothetical protein n=1 Tax=Sphingomonas sp. TaxID=28214 RepID=UPI002ED7F851